MSIIPPRLPKGFRDKLPADEYILQHCIKTLAVLFRGYGYVAIDTPVIEQAGVLLGSSGEETEKQVYRFTHANKHDLALRFDLTVPLARYMAMHHEELYTPFRRYHIGKVYRGENTQQGRYREFYQCDVDLVGSNSVYADFEILRIARESLLALKAEKHTIHLSHRKILPDFLTKNGYADDTTPILRIIDKARVHTKDALAELLQAQRLASNAVDTLLQFITQQSATLEIADVSPEAAEMIKELQIMADDAGFAFTVDPSITRGLHYYTGMVFESFLTDYPNVGSVCSGGRYDNLASRYTTKKLPGVGASVGLDRLLSVVNPAPTSSMPTVMVAFQDKTLGRHYQNIAAKLRAAGIQAETYPQWQRLVAQFQYAEKKSLSHAIICGTREYAENKVILRDLNERSVSEPIPIEECIRILTKI